MKNIWPSKLKIIRSNTKPSKASFRKDNYGGGTVMVWDRGNYYVYGEQPRNRCGKANFISFSTEKKQKANGRLCGSVAAMAKKISG